MNPLRTFTSPRIAGRAAVAILLLNVLPTALAGPHYQRSAPTCSLSSSGSTGTATCTGGVVAGLGNDDVRVAVTFSGSAATFCHNKGNPDNLVPGQNPAGATGSSTLNFSPDQIKNGSLTLPPITAVVTIPTPSAAASGCPNPNWSVILGPVTFGSGTYSFEQPPGTVVPKLSFSF